MHSFNDEYLKRILVFTPNSIRGNYIFNYMTIFHPVFSVLFQLHNPSASYVISYSSQIQWVNVEIVKLFLCHLLNLSFASSLLIS